MVEMTSGARKKATTDWPSEMSNRSSLKVILYLPTFCFEELSLEKAKLPPSSSSLGAPVATLQTLTVPSSLQETTRRHVSGSGDNTIKMMWTRRHVSESTYFVADVLKI